MKALACYSCGTPFAIDDTLYELRRADKREFHCPNGHRQHFLDPSEAEKEIAHLRQLAEDWRENYRRSEDSLDEWKHTLRHCPICHGRVSQARSPEVAAHKLSLHLQQVHNARGALLALMPASEA